MTLGIELDPVGVARIMGYVGKAQLFDSWEAAAENCREGNGHAFPTETDDAYWMRFAKRVCRQTDLGNITYAYDLAIAVPTQSAHAEVPNYTEAFKTLSKKPVLLVRGETSDLLARATADKMMAFAPKIGSSSKSQMWVMCRSCRKWMLGHASRHFSLQ